MPLQRILSILAETAADGGDGKSSIAERGFAHDWFDGAPTADPHTQSFTEESIQPMAVQLAEHASEPSIQYGGGNETGDTNSLSQVDYITQLETYEFSDSSHNARHSAVSTTFSHGASNSSSEYLPASHSSRSDAGFVVVRNNVADAHMTYTLDQPLSGDEEAQVYTDTRYELLPDGSVACHNITKTIQRRSLALQSGKFQIHSSLILFGQYGKRLINGLHCFRCHTSSK